MFQVFISDILKEIKNSFFFNSDEEFTKISVESASDIGSFKGFRLKYNLSTYETVQLINGSSVKPYVIKSKLRSDVIGKVAFVIDSDSLENRLDIGIVAWGWEVHKTQTSSTSDISDKGFQQSVDVYFYAQMTRTVLFARVR